MLALTADWMIARASANLTDYIGVSPEDAIGLPLNDIFPIAAVHDLRNRAAMLRGPDAVERLFDCEIVMGAPHFDVAIRYSGGQVIVEAEWASGEHGDATGMVRSMNARLDQVPDMASFFREGAR